MIVCLISACGAAPKGDALGSAPADLDSANGLADESSALVDDPAPEVLADTRTLHDEVRLGLVRHESADPAEIALADQSAVILADLLFDGLVDPVGAEGRLRPGLAASWSADDSNKIWTFELDPERGVTAETVVASFERLGEVDIRASTATVLATIVEVRAVDEASVEFELVAPDAGFAWLLSGLGLSVVGDEMTPTGRYELSRSDAKGVVLTPRVGEDLPTVSIQWADDEAAAYQLLVNGEVDAAVADRSGAKDAIDRFDADQADRAITRFVVLNRESTALSDLKVRQAVYGAIDVAELIDGPHQLSLNPAEGVTARSVAGFKAGGCVECEKVGGVDPSSVPPLTIACIDDDRVCLARQVAEQLVAAGYEVSVEELPAAELAAAIVDGEADLFDFGWVAAAGSTDAVVPYLLSPRSPVNVAKIDSSEIEMLIDLGRRTSNDQARWGHYGKAQHVALSEALLLPVAARADTLVRARHAQSLIGRADGSLDLVASRNVTSADG